MKKAIAGIFLLICMPFSAFSSSAIIPKPKQMIWGSGSWAVPSSSEICFTGDAAPSAKWLQKLISPLTQVVAHDLQNCKNGEWFLSLDPKLANIGDEGYRLVIGKNGVALSSSSQTGLFYAIQTLRQIIPPQIELSKTIANLSLPFVEIEDSPAYSWRGSMLDIARSFYGVDSIKNHIERMALFKLNRLHLHLTDDQGWRIEIKSYPNLANHGGRGAVQGGAPGFLTQAQFLDLQKYASDRNIVIIPEVEMPGHAYAALASYLDLNCKNFDNLSPKRATPPELYSGVDVQWDSLCLGKEEVKDFVSSVLGEISQITRGKWIHIGGDEASVENYGSFMTFAEEEVYHRGKTPIGWQEILTSRPNPNTVAQLWTQNDASSKNPKIISVCSWFYLDQSNTPAENLPNDWCKAGGVSLEDLYGFSSNGFSNILGIEAPVWTEYANDQSQLDDRVWPRLAAAAEVSWTQESNRNINDFRGRLAPFGERFDYMGIQFYETPTVNWIRGDHSQFPRSVFLNFAP